MTLTTPACNHVYEAASAMTLSICFPCALDTAGIEAHLVQPLWVSDLGRCHLQIQHSLCYMICAAPQLAVIHNGVGQQHDVSGHSVLRPQCHDRLHTTSRE